MYVLTAGAGDEQQLSAVRELEQQLAAIE